MKVSLKWISDYIDIFQIPLDDVVNKISISGLEVEAVQKTERIENLVIAKVKVAEKHPNSDHLNICTVFDGAEDLQIVCGAPNVRAGQTVVLAKVGAILPGDFKIKPAKIRGVESNGMLCSESELGLSDEHNGIMVLDDEYIAGADANAIIGLGEDVILELGITPNRGDCLSIYGVARDMAAILNLPIKSIWKEYPTADNSNLKQLTSVQINAKDACPYFGLKVIKGVKIAPSPKWMQDRIKSAGMRPVNNVVDVTNYIMLQHGQPMHAYDLRSIKDGIIVRYAKDGEILNTLDDKERVLTPEITVIADHEKILGIAGVMGGKYSGIADDTTNLLLECAYFTPDYISKSAKKLGMKSDASFRYTRGIDGGYSQFNMNYAAELIAEVCGGEVVSGELYDGEILAKTRNIQVSSQKINALIGEKISNEAIIGYLARLGIKAEQVGDTLNISVPSHRNDITHTAHITEEVARLFGLENIASVMPYIMSNSEPVPFATKKATDIRHMLANVGYTEVVNFSFMSQKYLSLFDNEEKFVAIKNPISNEMSHLRTVVYPGIIQSLAKNWNQGEKSIRMFEFATSFISNGAEKQPDEVLHLAFGTMGDYTPVSWVKSPAEDTFFYIKGVCESIFDTLKVKQEYKATTEKALHPGKGADIHINGTKIGFVGALHPDLEETLDLKAPVYIAELDFDMLIAMVDTKLKYKAFSRFPSVYKDISVLVPKSVTADELQNMITAASPIIQNVAIFDRYAGANLDANYISMAFRIWFSSMEATLTDDEVNPLLMKIAAMLEEKFNAKLR